MPVADLAAPPECLQDPTNPARMYGIEALLAGRTLGDRYLVLEVIGRGGMGAVYRARDERLGREVALKVISVPPVDLDTHQRLRARFHREARAAAALHHPNVVGVYDYGTDTALGLDFLVMELLRGEDLSTRLARKGVPAVPTALEILHQAARGLAAGHRAGLIHRDVKPGNLFLEPGDRVGEVQVRVLDFGIAEITGGDEATVTHLTVVGRSPFSPAFASPEQLRGDGRLTPATDVFSLGAVGFQLLTGKRAFQASEWRQMLVELSAAMASELPRVGGLPAGARAALQRALSPEPEQRFPNAGALADALEPFASDRASRTTEWDDDRTRVAEPEPVRSAPRPDRTRATTRFAPAPEFAPATEFAPPDTRSGYTRATAASVKEARSLDPRPPLQSAALQPSATPVSARASRGRLRRVAHATWNFAVTLLALALFAGVWMVALTGLDEGDLQMIYAGAAGSVVLTPLAVHRVTGSRGSYRFALFGSILGSLVAVYLLSDSESASATLAAMFLAQLALSLAAEHLSRGRRGDPLEGLEHT